MGRRGATKAQLVAAVRAAGLKTFSSDTKADLEALLRRLPDARGGAVGTSVALGTAVPPMSRVTLNTGNVKHPSNVLPRPVTSSGFRGHKPTPQTQLQVSLSNHVVRNNNNSSVYAASDGDGSGAGPPPSGPLGFALGFGGVPDPKNNTCDIDALIRAVGNDICSRMGNGLLYYAASLSEDSPWRVMFQEVDKVMKVQKVLVIVFPHLKAYTATLTAASDVNKAGRDPVRYFWDTVERQLRAHILSCMNPGNPAVNFAVGEIQKNYAIDKVESVNTVITSEHALNLVDPSNVRAIDLSADLSMSGAGRGGRAPRHPRAPRA